MKSEDVEKYAEEHPEEVFKDEENDCIEIDGKLYIKCVMCGYWQEEDYIRDTYETFNIGKVCDDCYDEAREDF